MSKEKINHDEIGNLIELHPERFLEMKKEQYSVREIIFSEVIKLINNKDKYMLGPEKTKTASFIAANYIDVYNFLNELLKNNIIEGLD